MSCAALRLARYNVQLGTVDKRFFVGLQSPVAAGLVSFVPWVGFRYGIEVTGLLPYFFALLTIFAGLLMISNYRYSSFKELDFVGTVPYMVFVFTIVLLVLIVQNPPVVFLAVSIICHIGADRLVVQKASCKEEGSRFESRGLAKTALYGKIRSK